MEKKVNFNSDDTEDRNPCSFKTECRNCNFCDMEARPVMCLKLNCEYYTPCKLCGNNKPLDIHGKCRECDGSKKKLEQIVVRDPSGNAVLVDDTPPTNTLLPKIAEVTKISITMPGTPPPEYTKEERDMYNLQWAQYNGFYRDPTAYTICHNIILLEIELNWHMSFMRQNREVVSRNMDSKQRRLIENLKILRDQLPNKEAQDLSDDEKSLGMILERYAQEIKARRVGGISRLLSQDAIALAPALHFRINPIDLMKRCGYAMADISDVIGKVQDMQDIPSDPKDLLEFLGFYLTEKYAVDDHDAPVIPEDDIPIPEVENFPEIMED